MCVILFKLIQSIFVTFEALEYKKYWSFSQNTHGMPKNYTKKKFNLRAQSNMNKVKI